jgi:hypothetical protein
MKGLFLILALSNDAHAVTKLEYQDFTIWHNCNTKSAVRFEYIAKKDIGFEPRLEKFGFDPNYPIQ